MRHYRSICILVAKGSCKVYALAVNGARKTITVTVK